MYIFTVVPCRAEPGATAGYRAGSALSAVGLQRVAVSHHVVHASAARTERNFSWAGIVATAKRNRLSPQALEWLGFLKRNSQFLPTQEEMAAEYLRRYRKKRPQVTTAVM